MAHANILTKLKARNNEAPVNITDRVYQAMLEDAKDSIREKVTSEARMGVQAELSAAQARASQAEADAAKAQAELARTKARNESLTFQMKETESGLKKKIEGLETSLKALQGKTKDREYQNEIDQLQGQIKKLNKQMGTLEKTNANLTGQVQALKSQPKPVKKPKPIAFDIAEVKRGVDNRVTGATIKPVWSN